MADVIVRIEIEIDVVAGTATASLHFGDQEKPGHVVLASALSGKWASATEGLVCAIETLVEFVRVDAKKLGIPVRAPVYWNNQGEDPKAQA